MKLLSYNIFDGAANTFQKIIKVVQDAKPDYVTLNEANSFARDNKRLLKDFARICDFSYFDIALSGEFDYHVAVFSRYPLKNVVKLQPLARACLIAQVGTPLGEISIASLHLTPLTEDDRHPEIDLIVKAQEGSENRILMGDMNSLSPHDNYDSGMIYEFDEAQKRKFVRNSRLRFDAIKKIEGVGYFDASVLTKRNQEHTVPTLISPNMMIPSMRLDYIFVTKGLKSSIRDYSVIKNKLTDSASDHYPVLVNLK